MILYIDFADEPEAAKWFGAYFAALNEERAREVLGRVFESEYVEHLISKATFAVSRKGVDNEHTN